MISVYLWLNKVIGKFFLSGIVKKSLEFNKLGYLLPCNPGGGARPPRLSEIKARDGGQACPKEEPRSFCLICVNSCSFVAEQLLVDNNHGYGKPTFKHSRS